MAAAPMAHGMPSHRLQHDSVGYFGDLGRHCHDRDTDWRDRGRCRCRCRCRDNDWDRYRYTRREHCRNADWDGYRYDPYRYNGHHHDCGHWHR
ncbi:hypothetical protein [Streptomyces anandii]|uniref:hypothetical protein n=1 Tax=Streptomyces anandii TaxID=285454 RepID=UPI003697B0D0